MNKNNTTADITITTIEPGYARVRCGRKDIGRVVRDTTDSSTRSGFSWTYRYAWATKGERAASFDTRAEAVAALIARHETRNA